MKKALKYMLIFISYFIYSILFKSILYSFNINFYNLDTKYKLITNVLIESIYILIILFIYRKELKEEIVNFKNNYKIYIFKYIFIYLLGILLMAISNIIITKVTNQNLSGNELIVREYIKKFPLYMIFSSVIYSPLMEEIIFRKTIKKIINNKYIFILASGIIFGLLHVSNFGDITELLFSISYIIMGIVFAYIYFKTDNIFTTITFHLCHNLILLIIQFL